MNDVASLLGTEPLSNQHGQPLRVAVYSRVAEAIASGRAKPGTLLPTEAELGTALGVSRTVVREALMLLDEDQLITTRRGVGRFVAVEPARFGLERIAPFDELLAGNEPDQHFAISRADVFYLQDGTEFTARGLDIDASTPTWFWESIISRDGTPVAIVQEHVVAPEDGDRSSGQRTRIAAIARKGEPRTSTLLSIIRQDLGGQLGPGEIEISTGPVGSTRGKMLSLPASHQIIVLTHKLVRHDEAIYLGKYLIVPDLVRLVVRQAAL